MKLVTPSFNSALSPPRFTNAIEKLSHLQRELVSDALRRAVDDVNAAMAHKLGEPLTALLLYLHEIRHVAPSDVGETAAASLREVVDMALIEAGRMLDIVERAAKPGEMDTEAGIARGREAIDMWTVDHRVREGVGALPADRPAKLHPLTPREREVLALVVDGSSNKEGGYRLGISTRTFEAHRAHLMAKMGARNAADLIRKTSSRIDDV